MWSTICTIHDLCNWLWFAGCGENCKCFVYVCVRFWNLLKSFALYCIFWWLFLFIVFIERPRAASDRRHGGSVRRRTGQIIVGVDDGGDSDGSKMSSVELQMQKKKKKKEKHVFSFFPSATHKEEKKTKRLRSISPIRNRLQIKLWKFSGSVAFEVRRQKTEGRLFLEHYYLFAPFLSFLFVFSSFS